MSNIKEQLYVLCVEYLKNKEAEIRKIIDEAQEAANEDTKSSAGDKFETGREVMQQDIDLNQTRLNDLKNLRAVLDRIIPGQKSSVVAPGSAVYTNNGNFYISISAGQLKVDGTTYYAVSAASPIGAQLSGQKSGHEFTLNGKKFVIEKVL